MHILEAGFESPGRPLALLLHGFPDLAYGWRHLMPLLANAGYHVVAPDQNEFAEPPTYYVMERGKTMPENVAPFEPSAAEVKACQWLTEPELAVYIEEYSRTGFQGGLQTYRVYTDPTLTAELRLFSGRTIDVPSLFIGGKSDWATYVSPGALDLMRTKATTRMSNIQLIDGSGHWIQPRLSAILLAFASEAGTPISQKMQ